MPSQPPAISAFGRCLSYEMRAQRISCLTLAQITGISERLIRKYKSGRTVPRDYYGDPSQNAQKIAAALRVPVDQMFAEDDEPVAA